MRALCWHGKGDIRCDTVADPKIEDARDVSQGLELRHLRLGPAPDGRSDADHGKRRCARPRILGEVVEVGSPDHKLKKGDRIVVPFNINCGQCRQCKLGNWACCTRSNRNAEMAAKVQGYPTAGLFGYSHLTGGYWGGQAEYVPRTHGGCRPDESARSMTDEQALFLSDILPTGWQGADIATSRAVKSSPCGARAGRPVRD